MEFKSDLIHGKLIRRYKRFLADIELDDGTRVVAHCTNSGSMKSCIEEGAEVYLSPAADPKRKTRYTWEMIKINAKWVGINTLVPNQLAFEALSKKLIPGLDRYDFVKREVKWGDSRFDLMATNEEESCFVEVKNVTMKVGDAALFPDAVTSRGLKHLETLIRVKAEGMRAVMLYIVQRSDVSHFGPAEVIDPDYAKGLRKAAAAGVELFAVQALVSPSEITLGRRLPVVL
ncbi:DNA/RNA nuclease SfsA [Roseimarinus sediminis]|uniref:DNA/RNA nuclease SfsA n=1 Tax=Roseimarinus sediminis TaxID=1610899 RepID=UPI003D200720